uniref:Uncharacterized protein n=1 Tax=Oryza meridionalis TaxID=40149 RepID=A0A0E0DW16_9ORYZ
MVMSTCSLTLNGPGLSVNSHGRPRKKACSGSVAAMRRPSGTTAICAEMAVMVSGSLRYQKNWLRKESTAHDAVPSTHILNVSTGVSGSSLTGTVSVTCSTERGGDHRIAMMIKLFFFLSRLLHTCFVVEHHGRFGSSKVPSGSID